MKSVFMVLFLLGGLAISNADAQSCQPAAKGSSTVACKPDAGPAATVSLLPGTPGACTPQQMATCTPEQMAACTPEQMAACAGKKMSKKEMKECQAICQGKVAAAPSTGQAVLAGQPVTMSSQPVAPPKASKQ